MRLLLDQNLSPSLVDRLSSAGHDVIHVRGLGMSTATDAQIVERAERDQRVVVSADSDFGELLAVTNQSRPSVVLLRRQGNRRALEVADLLILNLPAVQEDLKRGAIVVLDADRIRVRALPLDPD